MSRLGRGALTAFRPNPDTILPTVAPHSRGFRTYLVRAARGSYGNRLRHLQNQDEHVCRAVTEWCRCTGTCPGHQISPPKITSQDVDYTGPHAYRQLLSCSGPG